MKVWKRMMTGVLAAVLLAASGMTCVRGTVSIQAKAYLLMEAGTGKVLQAANERISLPVASTTKILTALLALEQPRPDELFSVDEAAIRVEGTSMGLRPGDRVSLRTLAYGMLLCSGNDAANAAAVRIAGSTAAFADCMNRRAAELGMEDSLFVTPSGLDAPGHSASALDLARLTRAALQNPDFREICGAKSALVSFGSPPFPRKLYNHNRLLADYPGCIGVKTGYTKKAGRCLVSAACRDGVTLICVTLSAADDWNLHKRLLNEGFAAVSRLPLPLPQQKLEVPVVGGRAGSVTACPVGQAYACVDASDKLETTVCLEPFCYAPVAKGQVLGEIVYLLEGQVIARLPLTAARAVPSVSEKKRGLFGRLLDRLFGKT